MWNDYLQRMLALTILRPFPSLTLSCSPPPPPTHFQILAVFLIGLLIPLATLHYPATAAVGVGLAAALLFAVAIVGIVAAMTHHQVVLFCVSLSLNQ